jgi:hypothetical protein
MASAKLGFKHWPPARPSRQAFCALAATGMKPIEASNAAVNKRVMGLSKKIGGIQVCILVV